MAKTVNGGGEMTGGVRRYPRMERARSIVLKGTPPLWEIERGHLLAIMRDIGAPALVVEGQILMESPTGPRMVATLEALPAMGAEGERALRAHPRYRLAKHGLSRLMVYVRMMILHAGGVDPISARLEPLPWIYDLVTLPDGDALVIRTETEVLGQFLLWTSQPSEQDVRRAEHQFAFVGPVWSQQSAPRLEPLWHR